MRGQAGGHIINISSGNAVVRLPFSSYYVASKCALEGFSSCLRRELRPLGVQVSVIAPTFLKSGISDTIQMGAEPIDAYEPWKTMWQEAIQRSVRRAADPQLVAGCVALILRSLRPRELYLVGTGLRLARWARRWLPENLFYWGMAKALRAKAK